MGKFTYYHCYTEELWKGYERHGLLGEHFGIRCPQSIDICKSRLFNSILKKGGALYNYIKEHKCPLYVDRLQGGGFIFEYDYDKALIEEYQSLLGEDFLGFQLHEWLSNYKHDVGAKLGELPADQWTEENIKATVLEKYPYPNVFLEAMTAAEHAAAGKPEALEDFYANMTAIYKKRAREYPVIPVDSYFLMYPFEAENGARVIMPEVGAQIYDTRLQMCFARGVCRAHGIRLGAYYEPWGGDPFTVCRYCKSSKNEWGLGGSEDFPFEIGGENGGSSRSLQWRIHLYAYLSGAEIMSEEWGGYNTFTDEVMTELSEYGLVKKRFLDFVSKYPDVGEKVAPIAAVISNDLPCFVLDGYGGGRMDTMFGYPLEGELLEKNVVAKTGAKRIFQTAVEMQGNEARILINSDVPDAVDMLNEGDGEALRRYRYLVDLTGEHDFREKYPNCISVDEVENTLHALLPCRVDGGFHYLLNEADGGGYYLSVFNHSGVLKTQATGEVILEEATKTARITLKDERRLIPLEGNTDVTFADGTYSVTLKGGEWLFAKIV